MASMITGTGQVISSSTTVAKNPGATLVGIFVSAASATPTIAVYDSSATSTSTKIIDTFTPTAGTFYPMYCSAQQGIYIVISGTVSCSPVVG